MKMRKYKNTKIQKYENTYIFWYEKEILGRPEGDVVHSRDDFLPRIVHHPEI